MRHALILLQRALNSRLVQQLMEKCHLVNHGVAGRNHNVGGWHVLLQFIRRRKDGEVVGVGGVGYGKGEEAVDVHHVAPAQNRSIEILLAGCEPRFPLWLGDGIERAVYECWLAEDRSFDAYVEVFICER